MGFLKDFQADLNEEALALYNECHETLSAEAMFLCKDAHTAEDLVMCTFEEYYKNKDKYDPKKGSWIQWLKGIMRNIHYNETRGKAIRCTVYMSPEELALVQDSKVAENVENDEVLSRSDAEIVHQAIAGLSKDMREVILLRYFEDLPIAKIAQILKISKDSVKCRLYYARKVLAKRLGKKLGKVKKPMAVLVALLLGLSTVFGGWKAAEALGWLPSEEAPRTEEAQIAAEEETAEAQPAVEETISSDSNLTQEKGTTPMNLKAVKSVAAAAATALTLSASAEPVTPAIPASAYVQDGLIGHYDGWHITGAGENKWKDISEAGVLGDMNLTGSGITNGNASLCFPRGNTTFGKSGKLDTTGLAGLTIEAVFSSATPISSEKVTFGWSYAGGSNFRPTFYFGADKVQSIMPTVILADSLDGFDFSTRGTYTYVLDAAGGAAGGTILSAYARGVSFYSAGGQTFPQGMTSAPFSMPGYLNTNGSSLYADHPEAEICAIRVYNRALSADEITVNTNIDKIRFEGADPSALTWPEGCGIRWNSEEGQLECCVTVTSTAANPVSVNDGVFVAATNAWVEMGSSVTVKCQAADHHYVARWEGAPKDATMGENQVTFAASPCAISPFVVVNMPASTYVQDGLIAQWDGIDNAGIGQHNNAATEWVNLKDAAAPMTLTGEYAWSGSSIAFNVTGRGTFVVPATTRAQGRTVETAACPKGGTGSRYFFGNDYLPALYLSNSKFSIYARGGMNGAICERSVFDPINHFTTYGVSVNISTQETKTYFDGAYYLDKTTTCTPTYKTALTSYLAIVNNTSNNALDGDFYALRIYNRVLTDSEVALNTAIDKVRFEYVDPASDIWPEGVRWNSEKYVLECCVTVTSTAENPVSINDGGFASETNAWFEIGAPVTVKCKAADYYRVMRWDGAPQSVIVGNNQITFEASLRTISPVITYDMPVLAYVQKGLIAMWDGLNNAGIGRHNPNATEWVDLSGKAFNWTINTANGEWTEFGLRSKVLDKMATYNNTFKTFKTVEVRFDYNDEARTAIVWWGDTTKKRILSEYNSGYGGPGFLLSGGGKTQLLVANSVNTVAGVYDGDTLTTSYVNGEVATSSSATPSQDSMGNTCFLRRPIDRSFFAIRCYDRALLASEIGMNTAIDKVRFEGVDPFSDIWPDGVRFQNNQIEVRLTFTFDDTKGSIVLNGQVLTSGEPIWVKRDSSIKFMAMPKAGFRLKRWNGFYFDNLTLPQRQALEQTVTPFVPADDLVAQFVDESVGIWNVPGDFDTLAEALASDDVTEGDTIRLRSGVYIDTERTAMTVDSVALNVFANINKPVIVEGESGVVIDCNGDGTILIDHQDAILRNVVVSNFLNSSAEASPCLFVNQGVATNITVEGLTTLASNKGFSSAAVSIGAGGKLCGSRICNVTEDKNSIWCNLVIVKGGTICHTVISNCVEHGSLCQLIGTTSQKGLMQNCQVVDNSCAWGIRTAGSGACAIEGSLLQGNTFNGEFIAQDVYPLDVDSCCVISNKARNAVGKVANASGTSWLAIKNSLFAGNAPKGGSVLFAQRLKLINTTIANNDMSASSYGTIWLDKTSSWVSMTNTISSGNTLSDGKEITIFTKAGITGCTTNLAYSCFPDAEVGDSNHNISANPLFRRPEKNDFTLRSNSPCIDAGNNLDWNKKTDKDLLGNPRIQHRIIDMGCYEALRVGTVFFIR